MYNREEIKGKVKEYVLNATFSDKSKVDSETMIFREGILDSMGLVTLISFLEEQFGIQTEDTDLIEENFESIHAITEFVATRLQRQS